MMTRSPVAISRTTSSVAHIRAYFIILLVDCSRIFKQPAVRDHKMQTLIISPAAESAQVPCLWVEKGESYRDT